MGAKSKIGAALLEPVIEQGAKQLEPWVAPFARKIFGENTITKGTAEVLNKTSRIDIDTFSKGLDFDSGLREPLERTYSWAGEGKVEGYELLTIMGRDFKAEDLSAKAFNRAEKNYFKAQKKITEARSGVTGDKMRASSAYIQNPEGPPTHRTGQALKPPDPEFDRYVTEGHHAIILGEGQKIPLQHQSAELITPDQKSPIIEARERVMGVQSGNAEANIADVLETMTKGSRDAKLFAIGEQTDGIIDTVTANDALGLTGRKGSPAYKPRELSAAESIQFEELRSTGQVNTVGEFMDNFKSIETGATFKEGSFPSIRVYKPGTVHTKGANAPKPIKIIEIKTAKDHANRFNLIFDALDDAGVDTKAARQKFNVKSQKIDKNLDVYGEDHQLTHRLIEALKEKEGTAFYEIEQLGPEGIYNLPLEDAIKLDIRQVQEMETVLANVLQYRYQVIKDLFYEYNPKLGRDGFESLDADGKHTFFRKNVNTIAVRGKVTKAITLENSLKRPRNWDNHIADTFGWRPQSLFATVKEIEEVSKELAERVQPTLPGVE
jgi:DNA-directed RNA polymerase subunit L